MITHRIQEGYDQPPGKIRIPYEDSERNWFGRSANIFGVNTVSYSVTLGLLSRVPGGTAMTLAKCGPWKDRAGMSSRGAKSRVSQDGNLNLAKRRTLFMQGCTKEGVGRHDVGQCVHASA